MSLTSNTYNENILLVASGAGLAACAQELARKLGCTVDLAPTRREALSALKKREYSLLVLDETLARFEADQTEMLVAESGNASPLQINFALAGRDRVVREVRLALERREQEIARAQQAAARQLEGELSSALTGILLEVDLLLSGAALAAPERDRLAHVLDLTQAVRRRLSRPELQQPARALAWKTIPAIAGAI